MARLIADPMDWPGPPALLEVKPNLLGPGHRSGFTALPTTSGRRTGQGAHQYFVDASPPLRTLTDNYPLTLSGTGELGYNPLGPFTKCMSEYGAQLVVRW
jgi:hypothetical protein